MSSVEMDIEMPRYLIADDSPLSRDVIFVGQSELSVVDEFTPGSVPGQDDDDDFFDAAAASPHHVTLTASSYAMYHMRYQASASLGKRASLLLPKSLFAISCPSLYISCPSLYISCLNCIFHALVCIFHGGVCTFHALVCTFHARVCTFHALVCTFLYKFCPLFLPSDVSKLHPRWQCVFLII